MREKGVLLITVTGRTMEETLVHNHSLNQPGDIAILQGGSQIVQFEKDSIRSELCLMDPKDRRILFHVAEQNGFYPLFCIGERVYSKGGYTRFHEIFRQMMDHEVFYIDDLQEFQETAPSGKISLMAAYDVLRTCEKEMMEEGLEAPWGRTRINEQDYGIDVTARSKKQALIKVLGDMGITPGELIAVGDSDNDLEMLKFAGLGVAMGNAADNVKESADYVTFDNDHGGVAHVIEKFILN